MSSKPGPPWITIPTIDHQGLDSLASLQRAMHSPQAWLCFGMTWVGGNSDDWLQKPLKVSKVRPTSQTEQEYVNS